MLCALKLLSPYAENIPSPDWRRKKNLAYHNYIQKEYNSDDGLSGYNVSSLKAVRHRYILFVLMVSGLSIILGFRLMSVTVWQIVRVCSLTTILIGLCLLKERNKNFRRIGTVMTLNNEYWEQLTLTLSLSVSLMSPKRRRKNVSISKTLIWWESWIAYFDFPLFSVKQKTMCQTVIWSHRCIIPLWVE